ncbi:MAG: transposase family protein [Acetobacteraceae bacterium]
MDAIETGSDRIVVFVHGPEACRCCPDCGALSNRVHSRYQRRLFDLPSHGRVVELRLQARRLRCVSANCSRRIFAEPLPVEVARRSGRRTSRLDRLVHNLGIASCAARRRPRLDLSMPSASTSGRGDGASATAPFCAT